MYQFRLPKSVKIEISDYTTIACSSNIDCVDGNPCTEDTCINPGTSQASCSHPNSPVGKICNVSTGATCDGNGTCVPPPPVPTCSSSNCGACGDCGTCITQTSCGWTGSSCQQGTASCPVGFSQWYWTSCTANACNISTPPPTPPPPPPSTSSCSVSSWTFSPATPQVNSTVSVTVNGTATPNWNGASYSLDAGGWVSVSSGPPFNFSVLSGSAGLHTLRFAIGSGATVCGSSGLYSFSTQATQL